MPEGFADQREDEKAAEIGSQESGNRCNCVSVGSQHIKMSQKP
jgi:hypothetical protein